MRHLDEKTVLALATEEASLEESTRSHLETCEACRIRLEETRRTWSALAEDPAAALPDTPLWPRVARALDENGRARESAPVLRPVWKLSLSEAGRSPLAYAALLVLAVGIGGGHVAGRALLGSDAGALLTETVVEEQLIDYTALTGLPDGSLAANYLTEDLYFAEGDQGEEAQP